MRGASLVITSYSCHDTVFSPGSSYKAQHEKNFEQVDTYEKHTYYNQESVLMTCLWFYLGLLYCNLLQTFGKFS